MQSIIYPNHSLENATVDLVFKYRENNVKNTITLPYSELAGITSDIRSACALAENEQPAFKISYKEKEKKFSWIVGLTLGAKAYQSALRNEDFICHNDDLPEELPIETLIQGTLSAFSGPKLTGSPENHNNSSIPLPDQEVTDSVNITENSQPVISQKRDHEKWSAPKGSLLLCGLAAIVLVGLLGATRFGHIVKWGE
jgi:hypothetical protein